MIASYTVYRQIFPILPPSQTAMPWYFTLYTGPIRVMSASMAGARKEHHRRDVAGEGQEYYLILKGLGDEAYPSSKDAIESI
ncbi:MAG: hypothetical protein STHCBS139747_007921 [Sporothrix thermara]